MPQAVLQLFANCIPVKGFSRSAICDLQRGRIHLVPNSLADLFSAGKLEPARLEAKLDNEGKAIFKEYLSFLLKEELAFYCSEEESLHFPPLSPNWNYPAFISNCILDAHGELDYFDKAFLSQLDHLCCRYLQFRFFVPVTTCHIEQIVDLVSESEIKAIELIICDRPEADFDSHILQLAERCKKIRSILCHSASENKLLRKPFYDFGTVSKTTDTIMSSLHCGIVHSGYFQPNIPHFTESLHHNTCLNRKIGIDTEGNIKNCPSMPESFGNIKNTTLAEAIAKPGFKKYWNITKDQVDVCKDCEFRHICTDCRAYAEQPGDDYSKPLKCGYDPYTCTWEEWSTHPAKQKAIAFYTQQ